MTNQNEPQPVLTDDIDDEQYTASIINEMNEMNQAEGVDPIEPVGDVDDVPGIEAQGTDTVAGEVPPPSPEMPAAPMPNQVGQLHQLQAENERLQQSQTQAAVDEEIRRYEGELTNQGLPEDSDRYLASQQRQNLQNMVAMQQQSQNALLEQEGKMNAAMIYGEKYGVPPQSLMMHATPQAMEMAANQQKQINDLRADAAVSKRASVQSQVMDTARSTPNVSPNEDRLLDSASMKPHSAQTEEERAAVLRVVNGY
mgnify:FL=1